MGRYIQNIAGVSQNQKEAISIGAIENLQTSPEAQSNESREIREKIYSDQLGRTSFHTLTTKDEILVLNFPIFLGTETKKLVDYRSG